ncbi:ABC transporter permease, partial [Francisella tularensis subsp. holarctica]|nr:ABC transporter permease [Francisella tularensis subsp. holarctica]
YFILKFLKDLELTKEYLIFDHHKVKNLIELVANNFPTRVDKENSNKSNIVFTSIYTLGKNTNNLLQEIKESIGFLGDILLGYLTLIRKP